MGRLTHLVAATGAAMALTVVASAQAWAFDGFGPATADSTYAEQIRFEVELEGGEPDRLELLLRTPGSEASFVVPVEATGSSAVHVWDTSVDHLTPNTQVTYQWRAVTGDEVVVSQEQTIRYEDDRPGLDWQSAQLGEATVHWYGDSEAQALRFGELTAIGVANAEELLGTELAGPVDVFVYESRDEFFGALGPGAREWTGAAAFSPLRTIFMWNSREAGSPQYLEVAMLHEVTHIVFFDATDNPYHHPARWLNEGIATWSETRDAAEARAVVAAEADAGGLFAFEAITEQFPIGDRGGRLSYAQGTAMIDFIIDRYGTESIARITAAYREGASDEEALEAGTGVPADELYASFFSEFGVDQPEPIQPDPILPSNVERPPAGETDPGGVEGRPTVPPAEPRPGEDGEPSAELDASAVGILLGAAALVALIAAFAIWRRAGSGTIP